MPEDKLGKKGMLYLRLYNICSIIRHVLSVEDSQASQESIFPELGVSGFISSVPLPRLCCAVLSLVPLREGEIRTQLSSLVSLAECHLPPTVSVSVLFIHHTVSLMDIYECPHCFWKAKQKKLLPRDLFPFFHLCNFQSQYLITP